MAHIDIGTHARVIAFVHETGHGSHTVEQAQPERLQLECNIDFLLVGVITEDATGLDRPAPLLSRRDNFSLPNVFAKHEQNIFCLPLGSQTDESFAALHMESAHGFIEIDKTNS